MVFKGEMFLKKSLRHVDNCHEQNERSILFVQLINGVLNNFILKCYKTINSKILPVK
jgi:hypothetical protein